MGAGIKGGVPLAPAFETGSFFTLDFGESASSATRRYTVGPMIELRLPHSFAVECDALYQRLGFAERTKSIGVIFTLANVSANSWEFPVLLKYRLPGIRGAHPYVEGGPSFRAVSGVSVSTTTILEFGAGQVTGPVHSASDPHLDSRSALGVAAGAGLEFRAGALRISPEGRYTRWRADQMADPFLDSNQNRVDLLIGIAF